MSKSDNLSLSGLLIFSLYGLHTPFDQTITDNVRVLESESSKFLIRKLNKVSPC